ncbi:MAG TPA: two-component regulator propeller domain-containing protein [Nitrospiria bacterium]|nr:two-component regulator propeller domain-containing protein [Nitrospiria bacterium]
MFKLTIRRSFPFLVLLLLVVFAPDRTHPESASSTKRVPPRFTNFETGANVKSLAFEGEVLWIGLSNGIIRYDTRTTEEHRIYTSRSTHGGLLSNGVYKIFVDRSGVKWIGTYGGGLSRFDERQWTTYTPYGGGNTGYGAGWAQYRTGSGLGDLWVYDMLQDPRGALWIATWKGVSRFDGKRFRTYTTDDGLIDKWVYAIARDVRGDFWFGTEGGVSRFDGKRWKSWTHKDGLGADIGGDASSEDGNYSHHGGAKENRNANPNFVLSLAIDRSDVKWIGTWGAGLSRFDGKKWKTFTAGPGSIGGNFVHALAIDPKGRLLAATNGGISFFDGRRWTTYTTADGLLDNNVFSIAFDRKGNTWLGTWRGLSKMEGG